MKSIKTILAVIVLTSVFVSCSPTSLDEDESTPSEILATGGEDETEIDKTRD